MSAGVKELNLRAAMALVSCIKAITVVFCRLLNRECRCQTDPSGEGRLSILLKLTLTLMGQNVVTYARVS